jgi:hypothetical protein
MMRPIDLMIFLMLEVNAMLIAAAIYPLIFQRDGKRTN